MKPDGCPISSPIINCWLMLRPFAFMTPNFGQRRTVRLVALLCVFYSSFKGKIGIVVNYSFAQPVDESSEACREAAERYAQLECGLYAHPIFVGDWPPVIKALLEIKSREEGRSTSRLPTFTADELQMLKGIVKRCFKEKCHCFQAPPTSSVSTITRATSSAQAKTVLRTALSLI